MKATLRPSRFLLLALFSTSLLNACGKKDKEDDPSAGDGTVTWTHNGQTYTSKAYASAVVDSPTKLIITAAPDGDNSKVVSLVLYNLDTRGPGTYNLVQGSVLTDQPAAALTLSAGNGQGAMYNTLYGPNSINGTIVVTEYDKAKQKISGSFSYTAGPVAYTSAVGTQQVTNGSFAFTRLR